MSSSHFIHKHFCLEHHNACNRVLPLWKTHHLPKQPPLIVIDSCRNRVITARPWKLIESDHLVCGMMFGHFTMYSKPLTTKTPAPPLPIRSCFIVLTQKCLFNPLLLKLLLILALSLKCHSMILVTLYFHLQLRLLK